MKMTRNERNVLCSLLGRAIKKYEVLDAHTVTIEKFRYVDVGVFCFVARIVFKNGHVHKNVYLSTDIWSQELEYFCSKRNIEIGNL